ncbi:MAG TPA: SCO family protein [Steroidobacteraceae bacterium]|jgi:protein SCO1/2
MNLRSTRVLMILVVAAAALTGFWLAHRLDHSAPVLTSGTWLPTPRDPGQFTLVDQNNAQFTAARLKGAPTLVYFGFTHCPDVCPITLLELAQVVKAAVVPGLRVVFISVDPARDTPSQLAQYVHAFDPDFIGLTGTPAMLKTVARRFGVAYLRVDLPGGDYSMDHSSTVFLMDSRGHNVAVFNPPYDVKSLSQDLRRAAGDL